MPKDMKDQEKELELDDAQAGRNDEIYNAVFELCRVMTEEPGLEWDMAFIGEIADCAASILALQGKRVRFPAVVTGSDGTQHIEEYCSVSGQP